MRRATALYQPQRRMVARLPIAALLIVLIMLTQAASVSLLPAQETPARQTPAEEPKPPRGDWTNSTELSLVFTQGNSTIETIGLKDTVEYKTARSLTRFRIDVLRTYSSDDPYFQVDPGITFEPGETPQNITTRTIHPDPDLDVGRYFAEGRHERNLPWKMTWNTGASWDRNEDAGILSRTILFAGIGRVFRDLEEFSFRISYGLSYTDRIEEFEDPERDQAFPGFRLTSNLEDKWGKSTTYDNDFTFNVNVTDLSDYNVDFIQGIAVSMSDHLSLKVSLQFVYAGEPALEEVDVILRARIVDPDGIPGNGDEFFETVSSGGSEITVGQDLLRKKSLDSTFRASLLIKL